MPDDRNVTEAIACGRSARDKRSGDTRVAAVREVVAACISVTACWRARASGLQAGAVRGAEVPAGACAHL